MTKVFMLIAVITLITTCGCIHCDPWSKQDKIMEVAYLTLHTVDWMQTRHADWTEFYETNPILGDAPSKTKTDIYFLTTAILHPAVTHVLPETWRVWWQAITIGIEAGVVGNNFRIGMRLGF